MSDTPAANVEQDKYFSDIQAAFCSEAVWKPHQVYGPGSRLHYQLYLVLEGKGILQVRNQIYHLQKGDTIFLQPGTKMYLEADEYTPWDLAWTAFSGEQSGSWLKEVVYRDSPVRAFPDENGQFAESMLQLVRVFERTNSRPVEITGALMQLLSYLLPSPKTKIRRAEMKQYHLSRAKKYMEENYCYDIRIQDLARQIGIDRSYAYRLFMELEHLSPSEYLWKIRLHEACRMLDEDAAIADAAYSCGFADPESLTYHFKRTLNQTPDEYRWKHMQKKD